MPRFRAEFSTPLRLVERYVRAGYPIADALAEAAKTIDRICEENQWADVREVMQRIDKFEVPPRG